MPSFVVTRHIHSDHVEYEANDDYDYVDGMRL